MNQRTMKPFQIDEFSFNGASVFSKNGKNLLLGENGCMILLDNELAEAVERANPSDELKFKLVQHGLASFPGKQMFRPEKEIEVRYFILDLTKRCNFDCIYCFRSPSGAREMDNHTLELTLRFIQRYCEDHGLTRIGLQMWGGEPLLALDKIRSIARFFQNTGIRAAIDIETNASLITTEIAKELYELGVHVGVSIDGPPDIQNRQRRLYSGKGSAELVEKGIRNLQQFYGNDFGGIAVITALSFPHIARMLDYFIYDLGLSRIKFNLVRDNAHARESHLALTTEETESFFTLLLEYLEAYNLLGMGITESNIALRIRNLLERTGSSCCLSNGCQGGRHIVSIDWNGDVFPCEMTDFPEEKLGSIFDTVPLDDQILLAIKQHRYFLPKVDLRCKECCWRCYCGGGCSSRLRYLGQDGKIDQTECLINRILYPKIIEWILDGKVG